MKVTIVLLVVLGLIAAMSAVLLINIWPNVIAGTGIKTDAITVLVAAREIPAHTELKSGDLTEATLDLAQEGGYYANPNAYLKDMINVVGKTVSEDISEGQAITKNKIITDPDRAAILKELRPGMRAYPVKLTDDQIVGGLLSPQCFVDVLVTSRTRAGNRSVRGEAVSKTFLERVKVIAVKGEVEGRSMEEEGAPARTSRGGGGWTVTLLVNTTQAEALQLATTQGDISLTLRNPLDEVPVDSPGTVWDSGKIAVRGEFFDESVQEEVSDKSSQENSKTATDSIQIIRGSQVSEEKVAAEN